MYYIQHFVFGILREGQVEEREYRYKEEINSELDFRKGFLKYRTLDMTNTLLEVEREKETPGESTIPHHTSMLITCNFSLTCIKCRALLETKIKQ